MPIDTKTVHRHLKTIARVNTLLAVIALIAVIGVYIWIRSMSDRSNVIEEPTSQTNTNQQAPVEAVDAVDNEQLTKEYRDQVNEVLDGYNFDDSTKAEELSYKVLELRVPAELKQMHLKIVLALNQAQQGNYESAQTTISQLQQEFGWFHQ